MSKSNPDRKADRLQLEHLARDLAARQGASRAPGRSPTVIARLPLLAGLLREAYSGFVEASDERGTLSGVAEWLLDNFYLVQHAIRQVQENMPAGYYRRLPKLDASGLAGYPRVYALARRALEFAEGHVDVSRVERYVQAYQTERALTMGEVWALPTMLRLSVLELLTRAVARAAEIEITSLEEGWPALPDIEDEPDEAIVAAAINSLRAINAEDWDAFFEATSVVEERLRADPADVYARMDFETRDRYRGVVEELARASEAAELEVADQAVSLAEEGGARGQGDDQDTGAYGPRDGHVGFFLIGDGREKLERILGYRPRWLENLRRWVFHRATLVYLGSILALTALVLAGIAWYAKAGGATSWTVAAGLVVGLIPASMVGVNLVNMIVTRTISPCVLPKMDFSEGVPAECRTMVVVPALLTSHEEVDFLLRQLELHYLGNAGDELGFALLGDFADAPEKEMPEDEALLERARLGIERLNERYSRDSGRKPFFFFHRERLWNSAEGSWMGWERKRGKLAEFNRLLRNRGETSYFVKEGELEFLSAVQYVITLDADTVFPLGAGPRLTGTLAHPLNRARFLKGEAEGEHGRVVDGYTVLQPRTEVKPTAATKSWFTRVFAGDAGLDLYTRAVSNVYQDLFGEGIYTGKGIYDVDAFERSLEGRVPENALLSHDLFEGVHGRSGLVTDVVLFEDYPPTYLSYAYRKHRWVRGDWQILPWLLPWVPTADGGRAPNPLSALDRWKIFDNLRRSLRSPALLLLLVAGWLWLPGSPWAWTILAVIASGLPLVTGAMTAVARRLRSPQRPGSALGLGRDVERWLVDLAFLPYESILMADAIGTTLVRLTISRKRLLQWTTAAHTVRLFGRESRVGLLWRRMRGAPVVSVIVAAMLLWLQPQALPAAAVLLMGWLASPIIAAWIGRRAQQQPAQLSTQELQRLRHLARRTWLFFERYVGPEDHWLPPDHFQEEPRGTVAHRTSPTNIGLTLLSTLSAWEMGYESLMGLILRVSDAFDSMDELERYRGHFLNWYDTRDLSTLMPKYVSTVDSGNLAASLIALAQGLDGIQEVPILRWERWQGLCDTIGVLRDVVQDIDAEDVSDKAEGVSDAARSLCDKIAAVEDNPPAWVSLLDELEEQIGSILIPRLGALLEAGTGVLDVATLRDLRLWTERIHLHMSDLRGEISRLAPWMLGARDLPVLLTGGIESGEGGPAQRITSDQRWVELRETLQAVPPLHLLAETCHEGRSQVASLIRLLKDEHAVAESDGTENDNLNDLFQEAVHWCRDLDDAFEETRKRADSIMVDLVDRVERAQGYIRAMDFGFLYDRQQDVFHIGYRTDTEELDVNHYDLLASEARIASIVAIGKRDVPSEHWLHLGRPVTEINGRRALLSWGGSMFEYLMPNLVMRDYDETLLYEASRAAVARQMAYGHELGIPWGVSESGYYRFDGQQNYQYRGFGVPGLGRKRSLGEDHVVAPYASILAVGIAPDHVLENLDRLIDEGMLGHYGLYEAIDYTESRLPMGQSSAIVASYMVHHQAMTMLALSNYLNGRGIVDWFHRDPRVESVEFLLQEQVPRETAVERTPEEAVGVEAPERERVALEPWSVATDAPMPQVHFLSNGRYGVLITEAGAGYSAYVGSRTGEEEPTAITRWRADTTLDDSGVWIYVQDCDNEALWSTAEQPVGIPAEEDVVRFYPHKVEFRRRYGDISLHTEITVAAEEDVEIRRVTLTNLGDGPRQLRLSSYGELVLADQDQDRRHPAFNKMFIESRYVEDLNALFFTRRPRSAKEHPIHVAHVLVPDPALDATGAHETDRRRFIGRGRSVRCPVAMTRDGGEWLSGATGATLDPIMALGQEIEMPPHATARVAYLILAAESKEEAAALVRRYQSWTRINRAFAQAHALSQVDLRNRHLDVLDLRDIQQILSVLTYPHRALRADPQTLASNELAQSALWAMGISGDYPILLVRIANEEDVPLVRELLRAHAYWRDRRVKIDLVILNERDVGYAQELSNQLHQVITQLDSGSWMNRRGGIFMVRADQVDEAPRVLLATAARVVLDAGKGSLARQLSGLTERPSRLPVFTPTGREAERESTPEVERPTDLLFDNGLGGFSPDGREYVMYITSGARGEDREDWMPAPWINVVANPSFGFLVSDTGLGYSWAENSGENRLTAWGNDPVTNAPPEVLYLRDEETGTVWSPTPLPAGEDAPFLIRHGVGYSAFEHNSHGLEQELFVFAARDAPVKVVQMRLKNVWSHRRRLTATYYAAWVLGVHRDAEQQYVVPSYDSKTGAVLARNPHSPEFGERVAFVAASEEPHGVTADRDEFLGRKGDLRRPAGLQRMGLASTVVAGLDPCAALQVHIELDPGETKTFHFLLGQGADVQEATQLIERYRRPDEMVRAREETQNWWNNYMSSVTVSTPDPAMDVLLNRWLPYQALSCRLWGRSAFYQSSGAYGFRDQLQDVLSLLHAAPELAREHILRSARHQFEEGDVLHWWHPPSGRGVRTRISDDLLWLPYVTAEYVGITGDEAILEEEVPFRRGEPLDPDEEERYGHYDLTDERASVYEHCLRALERGSTEGPHGLPLIGSGDWNDGLNRVGLEGEGESVWLGWFLYDTLSRFARICERMRDGDRARALRQQAEELQRRLEETAWDGDWYIRATYDDGTALGSASSEECHIASMAQSWAVLSGAGDSDRAERAMAAVYDRLVHESDEASPGLIHLFTPPFDTTRRDPGYIKGYPPGIRENGGQYTHAALWAVWAYTKLGQGDRAAALFGMLNPVCHSDTRAKALRYAVEPYVVAADVYSADGWFGHGGWTWYTGSSGWMYRLGLEAILGIRRHGETLEVNPCIPGDWSGFRVDYRYGAAVYRIEVENLEGVSCGVRHLSVDGKDHQGGRFSLEDDGEEHAVRVQLG